MNVLNSKVLIAVLLITAGVMKANSQEPVSDSFNIKKAEINIAVADIFAKSNPFGYYYVNSSTVSTLYSISNEYIPQTNLQIGAKFHTVKGALRVTGGFNYSNYSSVDKTNNVEIKYTGSNARFATGYEWHFTITRVNIYYGADFSWTLSNYNYNLFDGANEVINKANITYLGINPFVGVNYFITPALSVGTELRFTAEMYTGNEKVNNVLVGKSYEYEIDGLRTYLGPLGFISVNIHF